LTYAKRVGILSVSQAITQAANERTNMNKIERKKAVRLWKQGVPLHLAGLGITRPMRPAGPSAPYRVTLATGRFTGKTAARDLTALRYQVCMLDARPVEFFCGGAR
jgi:hypothetical protein